tara:strand:+ start:821 stop:1720 length:900 start_codon:yes stop_codon:yes gene_type:complete
MNTEEVNRIVFTDIDLDGASSLLALKWHLGVKRIQYVGSSVSQLTDKLKGWLNRYDIKEFDEVYFLDLDISDEMKAFIDFPNVFIIDHHESHMEKVHLYKYANVDVTETTSTVKKVFKMIKTPLTKEQKLLVLMCDDYDSHKLVVPNSYELQLVFGNYQGDRIKCFNDEFSEGFHGFNLKQQKIIEYHKSKIQETIADTDIFTAVVTVSGREVTAYAGFSSTYINDVAQFLLKLPNSDLAIVINNKSNKVSFRSNDSSVVDVSKLAQTLTNGGGHPRAAGGVISEKFQTFTKLFDEAKL